MTEGWLCPKCGGAHAPDVKSCPNTIPYYPSTGYTPPKYLTCEACDDGRRPCMCVRPNRFSTPIDGYGFPTTC